MSIFADYCDEIGSFEPTSQYMAARVRLADRPPATGDGNEVIAKILIVGEVNPDMAAAVSDKLLFEAPAANLVSLEIDSEGGCARSAAFIHSMIRRHPAPRKEAYLRGACFSGALTIALAADHRVAAPSAKILLHPSRLELKCNSLGWTAESLMQQAAFLQAVDAEVVAMIIERTGAAADVIAREASTEECSDLTWCIENRIIHAISERLI